MMVTIVLLFTICWAPFHTVHMLFEYSKYGLMYFLQWKSICTPKDFFSFVTQKKSLGKVNLSKYAKQYSDDY